MDQISPPMRIVLVVALVFAAAWMLVLKPKDETAPAAAEPIPAAEAGGPDANSALGKAVEQANEAANASEAAGAAHSGETQTANPPATTQAAPDASSEKPVAPANREPVSEELQDLPGWLAKSIDKKVVAVLFTNGESADDRRTSKALQRAYGDEQDVVTRVVNVKKISAYQAVADGVDVSQSPTLLVIARDRSATATSGYATLNTINQAIIDALLVTDNPAESVPFLQKVQRECRAITNRDMIGVTEGETPLGARRNVEATVATMVDARSTLSKAPVPSAYKAQKAMTLRWLSSEIAVGRSLIGSLGGRVIDPIKVTRIAGANDKLAAEARLELNAVGVSTCN